MVSQTISADDLPSDIQEFYKGKETWISDCRLSKSQALVFRENEYVDIWFYSELRNRWKLRTENCFWREFSPNEVTVLTFLYTPKTGQPSYKKILAFSSYVHKDTDVPTINGLEYTDLDPKERAAICERLNEILEPTDSRMRYDNILEYFEDITKENYKTFAVERMNVLGESKYDYPLVDQNILN